MVTLPSSSSLNSLKREHDLETMTSIEDEPRWEDMTAKEIVDYLSNYTLLPSPNLNQVDLTAIENLRERDSSIPRNVSYSKLKKTFPYPGELKAAREKAWETLSKEEGFRPRIKSKWRNLGKRKRTVRMKKRIKGVWKGVNKKIRGQRMKKWCANRKQKTSKWLEKTRTQLTHSRPWKKMKGWLGGWKDERIKCNTKRGEAMLERARMLSVHYTPANDTHR
jgi:hypothetical protein